uniref:ENT domain-containing protein n=1 Tax=Oryza rufipogon TaxID=4529 RepID=A0A0E0PZU6_ORYRU
MKLVKGSKVEVLQEAEVPLGSWRGAEIVLGNGQSFYVRYDPSPVDSCAAVERVQRRLIRPCPPRDDSVCWAVGDILEAFDSYSWKIAEMVRVLGKDFYLVRLLGSSLELRTHASELRLRKHWKDGKWTVLQKDSTKCFGGSFRGQPKSGNLGSNFGKQRQPYCAMDNNLLLKNQKALEGDKSRGMKRKSSAITHPTQCSEVTRGMKRLQTPHRDGRHAALVAGVSPRLAEKVDAVDSPCLMLGEKYMHASLNKRKNGVHTTNLAGVNVDTENKFRPLTSAYPSDTESISSSVGSCSPSSSPCSSRHFYSAYQTGDICSRTDGAEAAVSERETSQHDKIIPKEDTHLLELHAYRATMLALYVCGSISWEQEALLTNLRLTLNISTDEHLAELRSMGRSRRLVKHPSVGPCRWRSLPHGLLYVKCGNIPSNFCWYLAHLAIRSSKSDASQGLRRFSRKTIFSPREAHEKEGQ